MIEITDNLYPTQAAVQASVLIQSLTGCILNRPEHNETHRKLPHLGFQGATIATLYPRVRKAFRGST